MGCRQLSCVKTTKSPRRVLVFAYVIGGWALPAYAHRYSPKKFTQPQLFACLVLKEFLRLDYRKLSALLADCPDLCAAIDLECVPHYTTFQKAASRLLISRLARRTLHWTVHVGIGQNFPICVAHQRFVIGDEHSYRSFDLSHGSILKVSRTARGSIKCIDAPSPGPSLAAQILPPSAAIALAHQCSPIP